MFPWQSTIGSKRKHLSEDSEDENFDMIDETGEDEKKKARKQARSAKAETLESLNEKWTNVCEELQKLKSKITRIGVKQSELQAKSKSSEDDLDNYMNSLNSETELQNSRSINAKIEKSKLKMQITQLSNEQRHLERMIKLAKPSFVMPEMPKISISLNAKELLKKAQEKREKKSNELSKEKNEEIKQKHDHSKKLNHLLEQNYKLHLPK